MSASKGRLMGKWVGCLLTCWVSISAIAQMPSGMLEQQRSVVKIHTTSTSYDYFTPWRLMNSRQGSGSGAVIEGKRILTNAHVVADASYVQVQKHGQARRFTAIVDRVAHEADLALLRVEDERFFEGVEPLPLGELPAPLTEVSVYGFPFGGSTLSVTRGVLSRVEHQSYAHSGGFLLSGQIDAAINPGNSGGPVIVDGHIVGVVMQANTGGRAENQGYFVPPSVVRHVMDDWRDGHYDGFPDPGFRTQNLDSPAMREFYQIDTEGVGVLVVEVFEGGAAEALLQKGDVILSLNGLKVADDSSVEFAHGQRTSYKYAIDQLQPGELLHLQLMRNGAETELSLEMPTEPRRFDLVLPERFEGAPEYLVFGGVVFVPLNMNLIKRWGKNWSTKAPMPFLMARTERVSEQGQEAVVALKVLAADVNLGYHDWTNWRIERVNGRLFSDFQEFCQLILNAESDYVRLSDDRGYQMILSRVQAEQSEAQILRQYRVTERGTCAEG